MEECLALLGSGDVDVASVLRYAHSLAHSEDAHVVHQELLAKFLYDGVRQALDGWVRAVDSKICAEAGVMTSGGVAELGNALRALEEAVECGRRVEEGSHRCRGQQQFVSNVCNALVVSSDHQEAYAALKAQIRHAVYNKGPLYDILVRGRRWLRTAHPSRNACWRVR